MNGAITADFYLIASTAMKAYVFLIFSRRWNDGCKAAADCMHWNPVQSMAALFTTGKELP
jgi:hypothetical protein